MKSFYSITLFFLFTFNNLTSQEIPEGNFHSKNYFSYQINTSSYRMDENGKPLRFLYPVFTENDDETASFIKTHSYRFLYIMRNKVEWDSLIKFYPDTLKITRGVNKAYQNSKFIIPVNALLHPQKHHQQYTTDEMMTVASRFFLMESNYSAHVCVSINGIDELKKNKDYTLLEATLYDAIFNGILQEKEPEFKKKLMEYLGKFNDKETLKTNDLEATRQMLFSKMKNDDSLKEFLLEYHHINQDNIPYILI